MLLPGWIPEPSGTIYFLMTQPAKQAGDALIKARELLSASSDTPLLDAQLLLGHVLGVTKTRLLAHPETVLDAGQADQFSRLLAQRITGTPLPYLLGHWDFFGRTFRVTSDVLIPRPETELLVEQAIDWLGKRPLPAHVADVGTGSGCIAISIALERPDAQVFGLDLSREALDVARNNGRLHGAGNLAWLRSDLLANLPQTALPLDLLCANLPYIPTSTWQSLEVARHEPRLALDGGEDGLRVIERLLAQAVGKMAKAGLILLEIEATTGNAAVDLAQKIFPNSSVAILEDYSNLPRIVRIDVN